MPSSSTPPTADQQQQQQQYNNDDDSYNYEQHEQEQEQERAALMYSSDDSISDAYFAEPVFLRSMSTLTATASLCYSPDSKRSISYGALDSIQTLDDDIEDDDAIDAIDDDDDIDDKQYPVIPEHEQFESHAVPTVPPPPRRIANHHNHHQHYNPNSTRARRAMMQQQQERLMQQPKIKQEEDHYEDEQWIARHHHQQVILRGKVQPEKWHDVFWLILFSLHLLVIVASAASFGTHSVFIHGGATEIANASGSGASSLVATVSAPVSAPAPVLSSAPAPIAVVKAMIAKTPSSQSINLSPTTTDTNLDDDALLTTFLDPILAQAAPVTTQPKNDYIPSFAPTAPSSKTQTLQPENYNYFQIDYQTVIEVVTITGIYACILSTLTVGFMLILGKSLIQTALIFTMVTSLVWGLFGLAIQQSGSIIGDDDLLMNSGGQSFSYLISIWGFCALGLTLGYTLWVWNDSLPLSATHVHTALCGMRESSSDTLLMGIVMLVVAFGWCILWSMAFIGIVDAVPDDNHVGIFMVYGLLLISLCWTNLVIKNVVQVAVASAVGVWWFEPDSIIPCCSFGLNNTNHKQPALRRSMTTSLGSICLGSLILLPVQVYQFLAFWLPDRFRLRHINRYAYTYIGLYGYNFMDAGRKARQLFDMTGGWRLVADDYLIHLVLLMVCIGLAGSTGTFGVLMEEVDGYEFTTFHKPVITAFVVGATIGFVLSNILLLGVLDSSVNTVLVCFAASPREFHENHPHLSNEMREVWTTHVWRDHRLTQQQHNP